MYRENIHIKPTKRGYIVKVGCIQDVFIDPNLMLDKIEEYLKNPDKVAKEYNVPRAAHEEVCKVDGIEE